MESRKVLTLSGNSESISESNKIGPMLISLFVFAGEFFKDLIFQPRFCHSRLYLSQSDPIIKCGHLPCMFPYSCLKEGNILRFLPASWSGDPFQTLSRGAHAPVDSYCCSAGLGGSTALSSKDLQGGQLGSPLKVRFHLILELSHPLPRSTRSFSQTLDELHIWASWVEVTSRNPDSGMDFKTERHKIMNLSKSSYGVVWYIVGKGTSPWWQWWPSFLSATAWERDIE